MSISDVGDLEEVKSNTEETEVPIEVDLKIQQKFPKVEGVTTPVHPVVLGYLKTAAGKLSIAMHTVYQHTKRASDQATTEANRDSEESLKSPATTSGLSRTGVNPENFFVDSRETLITGKSVEERRLIEENREKRFEKLAEIMSPEPATLGDILQLTREAREASWKVRKFDLYENNLLFGPPSPDNSWNKYDFPHKVPEILLQKAEELGELSEKIRKEYMNMVMGFAKAIVTDLTNVEEPVNINENSKTEESLGADEKNA